MFETTTKRDPSKTKPNKRQLTPNLNPTQPRAITRIDVPHTTDRKHTQTRASPCARRGTKHTLPEVCRRAASRPLDAFFRSSLRSTPPFSISIESSRTLGARMPWQGY
jgi:hypothetical protein